MPQVTLYQDKVSKETNGETSHVQKKLKCLQKYLFQLFPNVPQAAEVQKL